MNAMPPTRLLTRRATLRSMALSVAAAASGTRISAEEKKPETVVQAESLGDGISLLTGAGGNIVILGGSDGAVMVDSGLENASLGTASAAKSHGGQVGLLINTHWHFDHTGGNNRFAAAGARIIASLNCLARVSKDHHNEFFKKDMPALPPKGRPVITIQDETQVHLNGEVIRLVPVAPAHTDTDIFVHFEKANVLHMGDVFFHGMYPFIDYTTNGWLGGMGAAVRTALDYTDEKTRIVPGHGAVATQAQLKEYLAFLEAMYERLHNLQADGHTLDEAVSTLPSKAYDEKLGKGFMTPELFVRCAYAGMLKHAEAGKKQTPQ